MKSVSASLLLVAVLLAGCGPSARSKPAPVEITGVVAPELRGTWQVTAIDAAGKPLSADVVAQTNLVYEFDEQYVTVSRQGEVINKMRASSDTAATPAQLTMMDDDFPIQAIYQASGDDGLLCLNTDDDDRNFPTEFKGHSSPKRDLLTLKRIAGAPAAQATPEASSEAAPAVAPEQSSAAPRPTEKPATGEPNVRRTRWRFVDAPLIFPQQDATAGVFIKQADGTWLAERTGAETQDYVLIEETPEYVELARPNRGFFVRLYNDHSTWRYGYQTDYQEMFKGQWE